MPKYISQEDKNYYLMAWNRGDSLKEIAAELNITVKQAIDRRILMNKKGANIPVRRVRKIPLEYLAKIRNMYESGMPMKKIAIKEGKALGTIHDQLIRSGCPYSRAKPGTTTYSRKILSKSTLSNRKYKAIIREGGTHA